MLLFSLAVVAGLALLVWSAGRFVDGAAATARHFRIPPLLIGMVIVGFGTSAPEMSVSAISSSQGNPDIALGNAIGSNITNIALILGIASLISPIAVHSRVLRKELPILSVVTAIAAFLFSDGMLDRQDAIMLLGIFALLTGWSVREGISKSSDDFGEEMEQELEQHRMPLKKALFLIALGLALLLLSSQMLVWGAVGIAAALGVSNLVIGLTIVAVGTSLPELASSVVAARKGEHDIALGNVLGSNLFNTLAVAGIAGSIHPAEIAPVVFSRDIMVMSVLTLSLFVFGYGFRGAGTGRINRIEGGFLVGSYVAYTIYLVMSSAS
ncbi:calcium/sodium antiporter [Chlorobaculum sp. 24CR]|uniref:calcium/sodium antiporter n=1 Tax=Chlorobaculum sp. 24CR TaxID=2508878 RepID=UPI00100C1A49|nr:calcium/sodium antiporter [Chlorobaculum sp. 24CR]RXK80035.1 calcium/sodium antiporter [Chlorobaculum sp. 24CR]